MSLISDFNLASVAGSFNIGNFKISLPSLEVSNSSIESAGLGGYLGSAGSIVQTLTRGARAAFCIGAVLTDPAMLLKTLSMCLDFIGATASALINDLYNTCMARLNSILANVYGIVLDTFKTIENIVNTIKNIGNMFEKLVNFWNNRSFNLLDGIFNKENCDFMVANLMRCMMASMIEPYLSKFKSKVTQKINDIGEKINADINKTMAPVSAMNNYINNQTMFVNKFVNQVSAIL